MWLWKFAELKGMGYHFFVSRLIVSVSTHLAVSGKTLDKYSSTHHKTTNPILFFEWKNWKNRTKVNDWIEFIFSVFILIYFSVFMAFILQNNNVILFLFTQQKKIRIWIESCTIFDLKAQSRRVLVQQWLR